MNNIITFGRFEGRSFEWLFFKAPWYAEYIHYKGIHRQRHNFSEEECDYFLELFTRASSLRGCCRYCQERPFIYVGLSTHRDGALGHIDFFCDECEYTGGSPTGYYEPSFFLPYEAPRCEQLRLTDFIKNRYIGPYERLTQQKMEQFFHNDTHFAHATPGFFRKGVMTA